MRRLLPLVLLLAAGCVPEVKEPQAINPGEVDLWFGEDHKNGACWGEIAPAPGIPDKYSLKMTFLIRNGDAKDWIDYRLRPLPHTDWSGHEKMYLYVYPEQTSGELHTKIVDPDVPSSINANHSLYEKTALRNEKPLPARQWTEIVIPLPSEKTHKDSISYLGFYVSCKSGAPVGKEFVFYVGIFDKPQMTEGVASGATPFELDATEILSEDFESGLSDKWELSEEAKLSKSPAEVVSGKASVVVDSRKSDKQWHQFLNTKSGTVKLKPGGTYLISFDYKVLATPKDDKGMYYVLIRTPDGIQHDLGWQRWREPAGMSGSRQAIVTLGDHPDYHPIFGVRFKGAIAIDNIKVLEIRNELD